MSTDWTPILTLTLSAEEYALLPRHPAYQYDYLHGQAIISPRPKHFHGVLEFAKWHGADPEELSAEVEIRPMNASDHADLPPLFADAFERVPPFGGLNCTQRLSASRLALEKTWTGGDGPWLPGASFTAVHSQKTTPLGGITITLVPGGDPSDSACYRWEDPEHIAIKDRATAQPHLTWIFVSPVWRSGGIASALLDSAVTALRNLGHTTLWTTFILGNDASMVWHWRSGFTLAPHPQSRRVLRRALKKKRN